MAITASTEAKIQIAQATNVTVCMDDPPDILLA